MLREAPGIKKLVLRAGKTDMRFGMGKLAAMLQTEQILILQRLCNLA